MAHIVPVGGYGHSAADVYHNGYKDGARSIDGGRRVDLRFMPPAYCRGYRKGIADARAGSVNSVMMR